MTLPTNFYPLMDAIETAFVSGSGLVPYTIATGSFSLNNYYPGRSTLDLAQDTLTRPQASVQLLSFKDANAWLKPNDKTMYDVEIAVRLAYHLDSRVLKDKRFIIEHNIANNAVYIAKCLQQLNNLTASFNYGYTGLCSGRLTFDRYTNIAMDYLNSIATADVLFTGKVILNNDTAIYSPASGAFENWKASAMAGSSQNYWTGSIQGIVLQQTSSTNTPTLTRNLQVNSANVLSFDGNDHYLSSNPVTTSLNQFTIAFLINSNEINSDIIFDTGAIFGDSNNSIAFQYDGSNRLVVSWFGTSGTTIRRITTGDSINTNYIYFLDFNTLSASNQIPTIWRNGSQATISSLTSTAQTGSFINKTWRLGIDTMGSGGGINGFIPEIIVYDRIIDSNEKYQTFTYFNKTYSLGL